MKVSEIKYQPDIQPNKQINNNKNISFEGLSIPKFLTKSAKPVETTVALSSAAQINKESLEWLNKNLLGKPAESIKEVYNACLNSDNNICKQAIDILKKYIPEQKMYYITDCSTNGTFLNDGRRIPENTPYPCAPMTRFYFGTNRQMFELA